MARMFLRPRATILLACMLGGSVTALADTVSDFYTGKTITLIISAGTGGGYDTNARLVARHLGRHIPGNPTIVPKNMPGGGHLVAANYMYNIAPKDGTALATLLPAFVSYQVLDGKQVEYDAAKFNWIGASDVDNHNLYIWHTAGIRSVDDAKKKEVLMGSTGAGSYTGLYPTLLNNLIGTKFKVVSGYKSTNEIHIAMERGEVQGRAGNLFSSLMSQNRDWVENKKIDILMQVGSKRDPNFKDVPLMTELAPNAEAKRILAIYSGDVALGRSFITTPGVPADRLTALRKAFDATMTDPEFLADAKKINLEIKPLGHVELTAAAMDILSTPAELIEKAKKANTPTSN